MGMNERHCFICRHFRDGEMKVPECDLYGDLRFFSSMKKLAENCPRFDLAKERHKNKCR